MPRFLDCATTMLYEEFQRIGDDVFQAFERVRDWAAGAPAVTDDSTAASAAAESAPKPDNDRSMAEFMSRLAGVGGMPG